MTVVSEDQKRDSAMQAYRLMAEEASDIVILHEPDRAISFVSHAIENVLGHKADGITYDSFQALIHPDDIEVSQTLTAVPLPGKTLTATFRVRGASGRYIWLETTTRGIYDKSTGKLANILSVSRDVSQRIEYELNVKAAQDRAESANKAKSRFLANMSHELRTPLNAVIGFTDMMRQETFGPLGNARYAEYATMIYDSGQLLLDLISDMLDMAKIEAGKFDLNLETVDFKTTVEDSVRILRDRAENNGLELELALPKEPLFLTADKRAIKQILLNLLSNAIKFTPAGGSVGVSVRTDNGFASISVKDTGVGIAPGDLERLGHPFEQVNGDPMIAKSGPGLGLALVRALTEKHGGALSIESEEGIGTEVCVSFPMGAKTRAAA